MRDRWISIGRTNTLSNIHEDDDDDMHIRQFIVDFFKGS